MQSILETLVHILRICWGSCISFSFELQVHDLAPKVNLLTGLVLFSLIGLLVFGTCCNCLLATLSWQNFDLVSITWNPTISRRSQQIPRNTFSETGQLNFCPAQYSGKKVQQQILAH
jgi:hypothetical protein